MKISTSAPEKPSEVLIHLEQGDSAKELSIGQLVHRESYERLRDQVIQHLGNLGTTASASPHEYPTGSGWTQFLDGTRGAGKSTFLSSVKVALEDDPKVKGNLACINLIDPSRIERSEIILLVILQQLRRRVDYALKEQRRRQDEAIRDEWHRAFKGVAGGLSMFAKDHHPLNDLDPELFMEWGLERAGDSMNLRSKLHRLFSTACKILDVRALMFAFDDADTDSTHAVSLLECIRKYLDAPLVMVLVTGDLELYSLLVRQHFALTVAGKREAALELQRRSTQGDRSSQYLRMIDHLEEQYLLKLFPIRRRMHLQPLWNVTLRSNCRVTHPNWGAEPISVKDVIQAIVKRGLRVKASGDVSIYVEFLLKQPLRSVLQVMASCAPYLKDSSETVLSTENWSVGLSTSLSRSLQALALTSLYKFSVDTDAIAAQEFPALTQAVFDLSLLDGDIDTAQYLRPMSSEQDIRVSFAALAAEVPNFCARRPGMALRYLLRGPGSVSLYSLARAHPGEKDPASLDRVYQFKSYMGIGRREDGLDWARRATAIVALPYSINPKARVVLPGVVGLNRRGRKSEQTARTAIRLAAENDEIEQLPVFALSLVDVSSNTGTRTYGSIFSLMGLIEKLLYADSHSDLEARTIFERAYPSLTVTAPNWSLQGNTDDLEDTEPLESSLKHESELYKQEKLWESIDKWRKSALESAEAISPSAIFLGKVWTRLFFSLQKASEELRPHSDFGEVMEIFALCVINAFLVEEAEHHLSASPNSNTMIFRIDRNNPRSSASWFVDKLKVISPQRINFPFTSIVATCPLLLGLLDEELDYAEALKPLFPVNMGINSIEKLLRPKLLAAQMKKVSIAGQVRTHSKSTKFGTRTGPTEDDEAPIA